RQLPPTNPTPPPSAAPTTAPTTAAADTPADTVTEQADAAFTADRRDVDPHDSAHTSVPATAPTTAAEARPLASRRRRLMRATVASSVRFLRCADVRERASPAYSCRGPRARAVGCWSAAVGSRSGFSFVAGGVWQAGGGDVVAGV